MAGDSGLPSAWVLGVRVHRLTLEQAVAAVLELTRRGGAHQIVTLNGSMLVRACGDDALRDLVNRASMVTADGVGVLLAGRIIGVGFPERIPGIDLIDRVCAGGAASRLRVFLLGAQPGVAGEAAAALARRHPGLEIAGMHHGYFQEDTDRAVTEQIRTSRAQLLLVAMGFPRQEQWLAAHLAASGASVGIGVGGSFDVIAARVSRAPRWMQRAGLEWLYRLTQDPRRWRTAAAFPLLIWLALRERLVRVGRNHQGES